MGTKAAKRTNVDQSKLFIETAREIEADEEKSAADKIMDRLAHTPPDPKQKIMAPRVKPKPAK